MKMISIIIVTLALAMVSEAQLIYDALKIPVLAGTICPATWTLETETVVTAAEFYVHTPAALGSRIFLVSASFVNLIWPTDVAKAAAIALGVLEARPESSATKNFCSLLAP